jgi:hypothetical protein
MPDRRTEKVCYQQNSTDQANNVRSRKGSHARQFKIIRQPNTFERYDLVPLEIEFPEKHQGMRQQRKCNQKSHKRTQVSENMKETLSTRGIMWARDALERERKRHVAKKGNAVSLQVQLPARKVSSQSQRQESRLVKTPNPPHTQSCLKNWTTGTHKQGKLTT